MSRGSPHVQQRPQPISIRQHQKKRASLPLAKIGANTDAQCRRYVCHVRLTVRRGAEKQVRPKNRAGVCELWTELGEGVRLTGQR